MNKPYQDYLGLSLLFLIPVSYLQYQFTGGRLGLLYQYQGMRTLDSTEIAELQSGICRCSIIGLS